MGTRELKFAPKELFEQTLEYMVIPTFDLVIEYGSEGIIVVKRKIPPYQGVWALPGLRMCKPESIEDTIQRIARNELGITVDPASRVFLGQYVGRFKTEHQRQDLSTGYYLRIDSTQPLKPNLVHFSSMKLVNSIPTTTGAMYRFYLDQFFAHREAGTL